MLSRVLGAYGRWLVRGRHAWWVVATVAVLSVLAGLSARSLETKDDLLAFLPADNPQIEEFESINRDFGGLDVVLVGVRTEDVFSADFLTRLDALSTEIKQVDSVTHVLSLTTVTDVAPSEEEGATAIDYTRLVDRVPTDEDEAAALRDRVMARDLVVGQLVSRDQRGVLIYVFATPDAEPRSLAAELEAITAERMATEEVHFGGAAMVSTYIYDTTQDDMAVLTPWAIGTILLIMIVAFRDIAGTALALVSTGLGILVSHAVMSGLGVSLNVVLSSMPIILFAVGSAYGIHLLARYQTHALDGDRAKALIHTLEKTGPTIFVSGLTTAIGLVSFVWMDIVPLQTFGIFTSLGILATLLFSLTLVPAVIFLARLPGRATLQGFGARLGIRCVIAVRRHRRSVGVALGVVLLIGAGAITEVDTRVDQSAFYSEGSPPALADSFLGESFGGSQFIQVRVRGDLGEPEVLREIQRTGDMIRQVPGVSRVSHVGDALSMGNVVVDGPQRIPNSRAQVGELMGLVLSGEPALGQLITPDRSQALIQIQIRASGPDEIEGILAAVETVVTERSRHQLDVVQLSDEPEAQVALDDRVALRLEAVARDGGLSVAKETGAIARDLASLDRSIDDQEYREQLVAMLRGTEAEDFIGEPVEASEAAAISTAVVEHHAWKGGDALYEALMTVRGRDGDLLDPLLAEMVGMYIESNSWTPYQPAAVSALAPRVARLLGVDLPDTDQGSRIAEGWVSALEDLSAPTAGAAGATFALEWTVSGLPMMHRGLSDSVRGNQIRSLVSALLLVAVLLSVAFRSLRAGLLATMPMAGALVLIYGGMGALGIRLDIGTSMLASLVIGAGVDYAVHFLSSWHARDNRGLEWGAATAAARCGPAIWTNALMVASGFLVLTLGEARPLQNVGGLTGAAMILAALTTFMFIPMLAQRRGYTRMSQEPDPADRLADVVLSGEVS